METTRSDFLAGREIAEREEEMMNQEQEKPKAEPETKNKPKKKPEPMYEVAFGHIEKGLDVLLDGAGVVADEVAEGAEFAGKKAEGIYETGRLHIRNCLLRKKLRYLFAELGEQVLELASKGVQDITGNRTVRETIEKVQSYREEMRLNAEKLRSSRAEKEEEKAEQSEEEQVTQKTQGPEWRQRTGKGGKKQ